MGKYIIILDGEIENMLIDSAKKHDKTVEQFISDIINRYLPLAHMINLEDMAKGYEEMAQINLELAK